MAKKYYVTTRRVDEFDLEDRFLLSFIKRCFPKDEEILHAQKIEDIKNYEEVLNEIAGELALSSWDINMKNIEFHASGYTDFDEAYEDMEFGKH